LNGRDEKRNLLAVALNEESRSAAVAPAVSRHARDQGGSAAQSRSRYDQTLASVLRERAEHDGERDGFIFLSYRGGGAPQEARLTYGGLLERARAIAAAMQTEGGRGDRVLILCPPGLDYIAAFFGCQLAGQVPVPTYPPRNAKHMGRLQAILADAGASSILVSCRSSVRLISYLLGNEMKPDTSRATTPDSLFVPYRAWFGTCATNAEGLPCRVRRRQSPARSGIPHHRGNHPGSCDI